MMNSTISEVASEATVTKSPSIHAGSSSTSSRKTAKLDSRPSLAEMTARSHSPEAKEKRARTLRQRAERVEQEVIRLGRDGMVPGGIARVLGIGEQRVRRILRAEVAKPTLPDDYVPLNGCRGCGRDFASLAAFDTHRIGRHEPMERRCMTEVEMIEAGLSRVVPGDSQKYEDRIAVVQLWWDADHADGARTAFGTGDAPSVR